MKRFVVLTVALMSTTLLEQPASGQRLDRREFETPAAIHRPTVTTSEGSGNKRPTLQEGAEHAFTGLGAGGIMLSPEGDPKRRKPGNAAAIAKLRVGLLDRYPPTATPWLPKELPG